ncbi:MAG: hypothetical protein Tsb0014_00470 [Pleurocapsa sp.]
MFISKTHLRSPYGKIILGFIFVTIYSLPLNAQTNTTQYEFLQNIEAGKDMNWGFSSEDETASLKDEIKKLGDYDLSASDTDLDVELLETEPKWGNRGDVEDHSIEAEVYDY